MAKIQLIVMYAIYAVYVAVSMMINNESPYRYISIMQIIWVFLLFSYVLVSIINIFYSSKLLKTMETDKIKKSAILVKLGSVPFWAAMPAVVSAMNMRGYGLSVVILFLYIFLLGTSVSGISYIRLLHKQGILGQKKTVLHTLLQFCFILDVAAIARLINAKNNNAAPQKENIA